MSHAKKILLVMVAVLTIGIVALPMFTAPVDAASVLESESHARAALGDSFYIEARGEIGIYTEDFESRALTKMHIEFTIVRNGTRGVMFEVNSGSLVLNYTTYTVTEGLGFAGRPSQGRFNSTIVFGFRINMTGPEGETISVGFLGAVLRNRNTRPILVMRGHVTLDDLEYNLVQRGIIRRLWIW